MKLSVNTKKLQDMVAKATKGASREVKKQSTNMIAVSVKDNVLTLMTTDECTYLYISEPVENEDFYVVLDIDRFVKLVSKLTCDTVTMEIKDDYLELVGNGHYNLELQYDGEGELVVLPDPRKKLDSATEKSQVNLSTLKMILSTARASLDMSKDYYGCYTGYYMGDEILSTDSYKICLIKTKLFETPIILRRETLDLVPFLSSESVDVVKDDKYIMFTTEGCTIFSQVLPYLSDFQVTEIKGLVENELKSNCIVDKAELLSMLDRLSLFVTGFDENGIKLTFDDSGIEITSMQNDGVENISYDNVENHEDYSCCLDVSKFADQIKSVLSDKVNIYYGNPNIIKIEDGVITKVVALFNED